MNVAGERILIFGDSLSHSGPDAGPTIIDVRAGDRSGTAPALSSAPGAVMAAHLLEDLQAQAVRIDARVGRSARSFFINEDASNLIANDVAFRPTKIVIMLATNDIDNGVSSAAIARTIQDLTRIKQAYRDKLGNVEIFAIGPPTYQDARYTQGAPIMLDALRTVFGADRTIDARPLTAVAGRASDGVHFTQPGAVIAGKQLAVALTTPPDALTTDTSAGAKIAIGVVAVVGLVGLSWLVLRAARRAAQAPFGKRRGLGIVDERLINRIAQALSYEVPKKEIHDQLVDEGYSEEDIYLAYKAAKMHLRYMDEPPPPWVKPDPSAFGRRYVRRERLAV